MTECRTNRAVIVAKVVTNDVIKMESDHEVEIF